MLKSNTPDPATAATLEHADPAARPAPSTRWLICALLFLATTINYMDRQVLGLLAPVLQKSIGWNDLQYSHIVIAFQAAYAIGLLTCGYWIDRLGAKRGYAIAIAVWSAAACLHAAARNVAQFAAARFALGLGESGNFPTAIKTVAEFFNPAERALATGIFNTGSNIGAIIAPLIVPWLAITFGWQSAFLALGAAGFAWILLWTLLYQTPTPTTTGSRPPAEPPQHPLAVSRPSPDPTPAGVARIARLLLHRQTWAFIMISAMGQPVGWFFLYWLPKFFNERYHLSIAHLGPPLVIVYSMAIVGGIVGGAIPSALIRRQWSLNAARKTALLAAALLTVPVAFATNAPNVWIATLLIGLGLFALQGWAANCYTVVSDLFPKSAVASVVGLGSFAGSVVSIAYSELAGIVLQHAGGYFLLFVLAALACPAGILMLHLLVPHWRPATPTGYPPDP